MKTEDSGNTNDETGVFRLSLDQNNFPADIPNAVVTRNQITVESIDHQRNEGGTISIDGPAIAIEFTEPHDSELESPEIVLYDGLPTFVYYLDIVFTALPRPALTVDGVPGFYLGAERFGVANGGDVRVHRGITPLRSGDAVPDIAIPHEFFIPIHEIEIRRDDYLWRLPVHVFRDLPGDAQTERERENFGIQLTSPRGFPAGITGFERRRQNVRIIDRGGGLVRFVDNNTSADGEAFNRSFVREGETLRVRVISTRTIQRPTPFSWRIFKIVGEFTVGATEDFASGDYLDTIEIPAGMNSVDFEVRTVDDGKAEGDETYFIELREPFDGSGFPSEFGRQIDTDPEKNRYTFTILDNDSTPVLGFASARTEAAEEGNIITIPFSLMESDPDNTLIPRIPDEGICLILEVSGTAIDGDVSHLDTSRPGGTTGPASSCDSTRGTNGTVDAPVGAGTIAEYIPGGSSGIPSMRLRIDDDDVLEVGEEITFSIPRRDRGFPSMWKAGEQTSHTVAIEASDNLISFAAPTSSLTENTTDRSARPSQEVPINIIGAVPEGEIEGDEKVIRLQASIATLDDTNMEDDVALSIAYHASSGIDLDSTGVLTIPANIGEVPLVVHAVDDGINDDQEVEQVTITLTEITESPLPTGWSIDTNNGNNVHTVSVIDDDDAAFVQLGEQYKDGYTVSEASQSWFEAPTFIEATQAAPPPPQGSPDGTSFAIRVELDENSPYYDYIGVSHADVTVDPSRTFAEQGLSRATVRFRYNETNRSVFFYTRDNSFEEGSVSINATLTPSGDLPGGWELGERTTLTINITDDDGTVFFDPGQPKIFNEGHGVVTLYLEASRTGLTHYRADVTLRDGEGNVLPRNGEFLSLPKLTNGTEYVGTMQADFNDSTRAGAVAQSPGSITPVATFTIHEDDNFTDEVVTYELSTPVLEPRGWGRVADPLVWTFTIEDKDTGGWIEFAEAESSVLEGDGGDLPVVIYLRQPISAEDTKVDLTFGGDAVMGEDYTVTGDAYDSDTGILTFPATRESVTLTITSAAEDDNVFSGHKELILELAERAGPDELPENWNVRPEGNRHTMTFFDNDLEIFFSSVTPRTVNEPDSGSETTMVTIGIDRAPTEDITVRVSAEALAEGEGRATLGSDFTLADADVIFTPSGSLERTIDINIVGDDKAEPAETFVLTLVDDNPTNSSREREGSGFLLGGNHTITILANDNTVGFVSGTAATLGENGGTARVEVSVDRPAPADITLDVSTSSTSTPAATLGTDYRISTTSLRIPAGQSSGTITLTGIDNEKGEESKNIVLMISSDNLPEGWTITDNKHTVTIHDDDFTVGFVSSGSEVQEPGSGSMTVPVPIEVKQSPPSTINLTITATSPDGATLGGLGSGDYSVPTAATFSMGDAARTRSGGVITVHADTAREEAETVVLTLGGSLPTGWNFGHQTYTLTILPNDNTVSIAPKSASTVPEGGTANIFVSVDKPPPSAITLSVSATSSSTPAAVENTDYSFPATLSIPANSNEGMLVVTGLDPDTDVKSGLTVDFTLSGDLPEGWDFVNASGMSVMSLTHQMTITDNDVDRIGWDQTAIEVPKPSTAGFTTLTISADRFPTDVDSGMVQAGTIPIHIDAASTATAGLANDFDASLGARNCGLVRWVDNQVGNSVTCDLYITPNISVGETIVLKIIPGRDAMEQLSAANLIVSPDTITVTIVDP